MAAKKRKKKKNQYSQEVKLLTALLCIVLAVAVVCVVIEQKEKSGGTASSGVSTSSEQTSSSGALSHNTSGNNTNSSASSQSATVSGSVTVSGDSTVSSEDSQTVDATVVFDDSSKIGYSLDSWNLILVNTQNTLSKDYVPDLHSKRIYGAHEGGYQISSQIYDAYNAMVAAAKKDGVKLVPCSAYRQYSSQERNFNNRVNQYISKGYTKEEAEKQTAQVIARPGTSEHQTGLVVDFNPCTDAFEKSAEYKWLSENAEDFGFVQRYKSSKSSITGIINESWHYRYVGVEHAKKMNELDYCLEEYIEYLKGQG